MASEEERTPTDDLSWDRGPAESRFVRLLVYPAVGLSGGLALGYVGLFGPLRRPVLCRASPVAFVRGDRRSRRVRADTLGQRPDEPGPAGEISVGARVARRDSLRAESRRGPACRCPPRRRWPPVRLVVRDVPRDLVRGDPRRQALGVLGWFLGSAGAIDPEKSTLPYAGRDDVDLRRLRDVKRLSVGPYTIL